MSKGILVYSFRGEFDLLALVGCRVDMGMKLARKEPVGSFVFSSCVRFALVAYSHWLKQSKRKVNMKDTNNQSDV